MTQTTNDNGDMKMMLTLAVGCFAKELSSPNVTDVAKDHYQKAFDLASLMLAKILEARMTPSQIRRLRKKLKLSAEDFAAALGFGRKSSRITVWQWEAGRRRPSAQTIMLMRQLGELNR